MKFKVSRTGIDVRECSLLARKLHILKTAKQYYSNKHFFQFITYVRLTLVAHIGAPSLFKSAFHTSTPGIPLESSFHLLTTKIAFHIFYCNRNGL